LTQNHALKSRPGTHDDFSNISFNGYLEVLNNWGFKEILSGAKEIVSVLGLTKDRWVIHWKDGVLIFSESYWNEKGLSSGTAYFNYRPNSKSSCYFQGFSGSSVLDDTGEVWVGSIDVRRNLRQCLSLMESKGRLLSVWVKQPPLWLLHYQEEKTPGFSYRDINNSRVAQLPVEIQKAIRGR
jgi:hypothetical protein